ncbi:MAG TPA: hypothetical protein VFW92_09895 [Candidatus Limnocylindrales bacterium]|nr:hypothetical protein [Candidatus Limnocylindrales bacterium]
MDDATHDERWSPGMPVLDRQPVPTRTGPGQRPGTPSRVPETRPTPLQAHFIHLSAVALVAGTIAISAWELGQPLSAPLVRLPTIVAAVILLVVTADAAVRIARSVAAWRGADGGRALFRVVWVGVLVLGLLLELGAIGLVLTA